MKVTVIGCWGGYPKVNEASSGYLLEHNGFFLLIDCGSGVLSKLQNFIKPEQLDAVILSHYHPDHVSDIGVLQHARLIQGYLGEKPKNLPIYGHALDHQEFSRLTYKDVTKGIAFDPNQILSIGPFKISFLLTAHPVPCYAMRIEGGGKSAVYTADTSFKDELALFCSEADVLLCECNFYAGQDGASAGHMTSFHAGQLAKAAKVKELVLTHLPHYGEIQQLKQEASEKFAGPVSLASEGLEIFI